MLHIILFTWPTHLNSLTLSTIKVLKDCESVGCLVVPTPHLDAHQHGARLHRGLHGHIPTRSVYDFRSHSIYFILSQYCLFSCSIFNVLHNKTMDREQNTWSHSGPWSWQKLSSRRMTYLMNDMLRNVWHADENDMVMNDMLMNDTSMSDMTMIGEWHDEERHADEWHA